MQTAAEALHGSHRRTNICAKGLWLHQQQAIRTLWWMRMHSDIKDIRMHISIVDLWRYSIADIESYQLRHQAL